MCWALVPTEGKRVEFNTGTSCFVVLHFITLHRYCNFSFFFFYKLKIHGNLRLSKSISTIFPTVLFFN